MLDAAALAMERRRALVATRGLLPVPVAGVALWGGLGIAGFFWTPGTWCLVVLVGSLLATPVAVAAVRRLARHLAGATPLATLIPPAMLPVALSLALAAAAYRADPSLVPLVLVVGFACHWPVVGWLLGTRVYAAHAVVRVLVGVALWLLVPDGRFTVLPLATAGVYAGTVVLVVGAVGRAGRELGAADS